MIISLFLLLNIFYLKNYKNIYKTDFLKVFMNGIKKSLVDLILPDYTKLNLMIFIPTVSFLSNYSKLFNESQYKDPYHNKNNYQDKFLIKRGQDRKNINRQTRKANSGFISKESYYEKQFSSKQNQERSLKGGFYCSYFSDLERENQKFRKYR